ncbi:hypothetical protein AKO1_013846 [Acrasis kona]|uniref:START domain-containing protein n=1 Tax=Acrasis kona TaxID=1008807 RepID=A0AAW2ZI87_9EUKA
MTQMLHSEDDIRKWLHLTEEKLDEAKKDLASMDGWELIKEDNGIRGYKISVPNDSHKKTKGGGIIKTNKSPEEFLKWLDQFDTPENAKTFDSACKYKQVIAKPTEELTIYHDKHKSPMALVSSRESVTIYRKFKDSDNRWFKIGTSVDHTSFPKPDRAHVRINMKLNALSVEKKKDGELEVWSVTHLDPGGSLPASLVNSYAVGGTSMLALKIKNLIEK